MTTYRAGMTPSGDAWQVERSANGLHPEVIASRLPTARAARALIDSIEGRLRPSRSDSDVAPPASGSERAGRGSGIAAPSSGSAAER